MSNTKITFKTINIQKDNFLQVINPDQQIVESDGILTYNTGIYGSKIDNAFPDFLIDLFLNSSGCHQNLVNLKSNLILGNNLQAEDDSKSSIIDPFIAKRNKSGDNLKMVYGKLSKDMALFNGSVLQVVWNRNGKVAECYHVPTQDFRLGKPNKYGQIEYGYISKTWGVISNSRQQRRKDSVKIRMFDPSVWEQHPVQLMYLKDYSYGYYATPAYNAGINWMLISREISDFHKNNIKTNFFLSGMLTQKKGGMSDEQIEENANEIEGFYSGNKGRKVLLSYVDDLTNDKPVFEKFSGDDQDKLFDILSQQAFQEIVTSHNAYSILAGVDSKGSDLGGDSNKLNTSIQAFEGLVTSGMKQILLDGLNRITEINGLPALTVVTEPLKITQPIQQAEDTTRSERRSMLFGLPELPEDINSNVPNGASNPNTIPGQ